MDGPAGCGVVGGAPRAASAPAPRRAWLGRAGARRARSSAIDPVELDVLYRAHVGSVYAFFACSVDRFTAEDLTAATFERVVRSWRRYDPSRGTAQTWIFAIARNVLIDHLRRQRHRAGPSLDEHPDIMDDVASNEDPLAATVTAEALRAWLGQLRPREREIIALRYCADVPVPDIARSLGLSEVNVHQICSRALRRLRASIDEPLDASAGGRG